MRAGCPQRVGGFVEVEAELEALWRLRPCGHAARSELEALWRLRPSLREACLHGVKTSTKPPTRCGSLPARLRHLQLAASSLPARPQHLHKASDSLRHGPNTSTKPPTRFGQPDCTTSTKPPTRCWQPTRCPVRCTVQFNRCGRQNATCSTSKLARSRQISC